MKRLIFLLLITAGCSTENEYTRTILPLEGVWGFRTDPLDQGIDQQWYNQEFDETVKLPGTMAENGKGDEVTLNTEWTGDIIDRSYFNDKKYEKYRQPGNIKIPFWLKPVKYYKGAAWYQKNFDLPDSWKDQRIMLFLERCHWESEVFINGKEAGSRNSLGTPHEYDITDLVVPGRNSISIKVDNRLIVPVGVNSHSVSDHTQGNWNGITGVLKLEATPRIFIDNIKVFPDIEKEVAKVVVSIKNPGNIDFRGDLKIRAKTAGSDREKILPVKKVPVITNSDQQQIMISYKIPNPELWSEFNPVIYNLVAILEDSDKKTTDVMSVDFGMREFKAIGTRFQINGIPVFLRGTTECCIFPLTGYPPTDTGSWERVLQTCREHGLNHVRFHSFCPPEAAFVAADRLGIYFHIECSSWANQGTSIGDGGSIDKFIYDESDRIIEKYGNHPSFCMLAYGNEPAGRNQNAYLGQLLNYWRSKDNRRLYTSAAGWPVIPENDYHLIPAPRIQQWGQGLRSLINGEAPRTNFDFSEVIRKYTVPVVGHEIGQWCVYPDFKEIEKYSGTLKPTNFEIFRETLEQNNMGKQAEDFLMASGKLQALCYKADIEAALRTPGYAGFEMLQLHDFPGQGTALVGILNPFFESKGYISPEEFRMFCNETVPLARMDKMIFTNGEKFETRVEIAHFGPASLKNAEIPCQVRDQNGKILREETMSIRELTTGNNIIGVFAMDIDGFEKAEKLTFEVSVAGTSFRNKWDLWIFPDTGKADNEDIYVTDDLDRNAEGILKKGGSVLLLSYGRVGKTKGADVAIGFSSIFWNTAWTNNQPPHTLGILCDPGHVLFRSFPTEYHTNWQWWDPITHSQAMILDGFPADLKPLLQPIDTWFENRRLALMFESETGGGKILVCSIDLEDISGERLVSKQLLASVLNYMKSDDFKPSVKVETEKIKSLFANNN